ncbi:uncharacterized protein BX663DRAFT_548864 [Cokeromyces recurvatus]|uniref:uncharacterized protein n=1 Tax=Cokeromyces recurvatus TaxID=90255 RepID=UPI002220A2D8|nr:uncharacterized protein BX663DRAFT_548864 [Cokeromyces recurvatus]KAI7906706.1 hypothetical protein BX663DRAFT_548864 [Cokeromyces recurvatus]
MEIYYLHGWMNFEHQRLYEAIVNLHSVLACQGCGMLWQRDKNASKNMYQILKAVLYGNDRSAIFQQSSN